MNFSIVTASGYGMRHIDGIISTKLDDACEHPAMAFINRWGFYTGRFTIRVEYSKYDTRGHHISPGITKLEYIGEVNALSYLERRRYREMIIQVENTSTVYHKTEVIFDLTTEHI